MAANQTMMDAIALVAASQTNDNQLTEQVLGRYESHAELARACAHVASLLAGTGSTRSAITGYLELIGATTGNGKQRG